MDLVTFFKGTADKSWNEHLISRVQPQFHIKIDINKISYLVEPDFNQKLDIKKLIEFLNYLL